MSNTDFKVNIKDRGTKQSVPIVFEEEVTDSEYYYIMEQLEEEWYYEEMMKDLSL